MKYKKIIVILSAIVIVCALGTYLVYAATVVSIDPEAFYSVTRVIDGDTFEVKVGRHNITVRMLGINTPETVDPRKPPECFGVEASNEAKHLLIGKSVRLELNPNREEKDRYGRYLAYVYLEEVLINKNLIENGFAKEYTYGKPYSMQREFRSTEKEAKDSKKGLWGKCIISSQGASTQVRK